MICPKCKSETKVVNSRPHRDDPTVIQRRRWCDDCGHKFNTFESTINAVTERARRRRKMASYRRHMDDTARAAEAERHKRDRLVASAHAEAAETGRPLADIAQAWGIAVPPARPASPNP